MHDNHLLFCLCEDFWGEHKGASNLHAVIVPSNDCGDLVVMYDNTQCVVLDTDLQLLDMVTFALKTKVKM